MVVLPLTVEDVEETLLLNYSDLYTSRVVCMVCGEVV